MAPLTKAETHLELSSIATYGSSVASSTSSSGETSHQQMMDAIFQLLLEIGLDEGILAKNFDQSQAEQAQMAQSQAAAAHVQTQNYLAQLAKMQQEQASAHRWSIFGDVMKWVGVAVGAIVGGLLCETPAGFAILAGVIALTASGLLNQGISDLGTAIGNAIGNSTWGNIIAQVVVIAVLTVATAGAEGIAAGFSGAASTASETAAEVGSQAVTKAVTEAAEDATEEVVEEVSSEAASEGSQAASDESSAGSSFKPRFGVATRMSLVTALTSTNLPGELLTQAIGAIPGNDRAKQIAEEVLTVITDIVITLAALYSCSGGSTLMDQISNNLPRLKTLLMGVQGIEGMANGSAKLGQGIYEYQAGETQLGLAPIEAMMKRFEAMGQILSSLTSVASQLNKSLTKTFENLDGVNFSADWQAAAQVLGSV